MSGRRKHSHLVAGVVIVILVLIMLSNVEANGRWGGTRPGIIDDRPQTVRDIEERADIRWTWNTAEAWVEEDAAACEVGGRETWRTYTNCMVQRSNTRILYMLRRGCVGVSTIESVCKIEGKVDGKEENR